jgi:hypothetical protein
VNRHTRRRVLFIVASLLLPLLGLVPAGATTPSPGDIVYPRGDAVFHGSPGSPLDFPVVAMAATPSGNGYWVVDARGKVSPYGDAGWYGDTSNWWSTQSMVGLAATPTGHGYWVLSTTGGIFAFGDARFYGSNSSGTSVAIAATSTGNGYWTITDSGHVSAFGDALFYGDASSTTLQWPVTAMALTADQHGYWLLLRNGSVIAYGDAVNLGDGSLSGKQFLTMSAKPGGGGYWLVAKDGTVFSEGNAAAFDKVSSSYAIVASAPTPSGNGLWAASSGVPPSGGVQGVVKDTKGTTLPNICVQATDRTTGVSGYGTTTVTGFYRILNLRPSTYTVNFADCQNSVYLPQWYNGASTPEAASGVTVSSNVTTTGIGASLTKGAVITGAVRNPAGQAINGCVTVVNTVTGEYAYGYSTVTGGYRAGPLRGGNYLVSFNDCGGDDYVPQWWPAADFDAAAIPVVAPLGSTTAGINAVLKPAGGIQGVVTDKNGSPLQGICVSARVPNAENHSDEVQFTGEARTTVTGFYRVTGIRPGGYRVSFYDCSTASYAPQYYNNVLNESQATTVKVNPGAMTVGIKASLAPGATISGTVSTADGPLYGGCVGAYLPGQQYAQQTSYTQWGTGAYTIPGLPAGTYSVHFASCYGAPQAAPQWLGGTATRAGSQSLTLAAGQQATGANATLSAPGSLSGTLKDATGQPAPYQCVLAVDPDGITSPTETSITGFYRLTSLASTTYKVGFNTCGLNAAGQEWFNNKANRVAADPVTVTAPSETPNINAQLDPPSSIAGVVTETGGQGANDVCVDVNNTAGNYVTTGQTSITGFYRINGLHAGLYKLHFTDCDPDVHVPEWYSDQTSLASATTVTTTAGQVSTANEQVALSIADAPTNVTASGGDAKATVSWTAPAYTGTSPLTTYEVTAWSNGWVVKTVVVPAGQTTATVTGLANGTAYRFRVAARNAWGLGKVSTPSNVTAPALTASLTTPSGLTSPVVATFNADVKGVTLSNFILRVTGPGSNLAATLVCTNASSATVSCATGPVRTAQLTPSSALSNGTSYTATVDPGGVTPIKDSAGNVVSPTSASFTASG